MTLLPAASAGAIFFTAISSGWLNGWTRIHELGQARAKPKLRANGDLCHYTQRGSLDIVEQLALSGCEVVLMRSQQCSVVITVRTV